MRRKSAKNEPQPRSIVCQMQHTIVNDYRNIQISQLLGDEEIILENMVQFQPADLYNVAAQPVEAIEARAAKRRSSHVFEDQELEKKATKRISLSQTFGDTKKLKTMDQMEKRQVQDETMVEMKETALASTSVIKKEGESFSIDGITAIRTEEVSDVLPKANLEVMFGKDVYPRALFVTDEEMESFADLCQSTMSKGYDEFNYEWKNETKNDFPPFYKHWLGSNGKDSTICTLRCFCAAMLYLIKTTKGRSSLSTLSTKNGPFPMIILETIQDKYFKSEKTLARNKVLTVNIGKMECDRLLAHTIAFALTIDPDNRIYPVEWSAFTRFSAPIIDKIGMALGAHKEAIPVAHKQQRGNYSLVLSGPPKPLGTPRARRKRK
ncbi:unnamed protein product, partial [Mesorhabditis belari]|uniref:Uncharacterized protein n=1 Tax=Mesorhabditis belari TaxID=2138241 RepID=A0AAF3J7W7_9BILA